MEEITLGTGEGEVTVPVYAQSLPYLINRTKRFAGKLGKFADGETSMDDIVGLLGGQTYQALCTVIPSLAKRMPEHQFLGYPSAEAMAAGDVDEEALKQAPTLPQIKAAFQVASRVNGLNSFQWLLDKVDPQMLWAGVNVRLAEALSTDSASSPLQSGALTQSDSGTTDPS